MMKKFMLIGIVCLMVFSAVNADTIDIVASNDTTVHNGSDTTDWSNYSYLPTTNNHWSLGLAAALVKWDLSSLAGATINSATLKVYALEFDPANTWEDVYAINSSWDEASATYANTIGATGFIGSKMAAAQVFGTGWADLSDRFTLVSSVTEMVQGWVDDSNTNNGLAFYHFNASPVSLASGEVGGNVLTIDYTPVPEPATMSLFGLMGIVALFKRRR